MVEVRLEGIVKSFGKVRALDNVNLEVRDGESMVLLGPSGCGKTTTLRIVAGLEKPDRGRVFFGDRDVTMLPPRSRNISMVFQSYAVWPHMSVFDNIAFPLKIKKYQESEIRRRVKWAAELLRIEDLLDRYPHQLSGGQRQRVAVARAIVVEPEVLLMDEPLSNLDALLRVAMRAELKRLQKELGITTVYVTHDQAEAMGLADRIAVMNRGKVVQVGTPREVFHEPSHIFVATFLGSPPMNILECTIEPRGGGGVVKCPGIERPLQWSPSGVERIYLGVRPEFIRVERSPGPGRWEATVEVVEPLGTEAVVTLTIGGAIVKAKVLDEGYRPGETVYLELDWSRVQAFDPETGRAIGELARTLRGLAG